LPSETSSKYEKSTNHIDAECSGGDHWVGNNVQGMEKITVEYIGAIPKNSTVAGYTVTNITTPVDSNEAFDTSSISFEKFLTRDA
jgi:hypothetical protein